MNAYPDITINAILPRYNCFEESLDQFVAEFETGFRRFSWVESEGWDDDCAEVYGRDGDAFKIDFPSDPWEWY